MFPSSWNWFCVCFFFFLQSSSLLLLSFFSFLLFLDVLFLFPLQIASALKVWIDFSKLLFLSIKLGKRNVCFLNAFAGGKNDIVTWKNGEANSIQGNLETGNHSPDGAGRETQSNLPEVVSKQILSIFKNRIPSLPWATLFIKHLLRLFVIADSSFLA